MARILIVEDQQQFRYVLRRLLEKWGHQVVEAQDGAQAIALFREQPTDLIVTDILMPGKDGLELILELREDFPKIKIIAISGAYKHPDKPMDTLMAAQAVGAFQVLEKPFKNEDLQAAVTKSLGSWKNLSSKIRGL